MHTCGIKGPYHLWVMQAVLDSCCERCLRRLPFPSSPGAGSAAGSRRQQCCSSQRSSCSFHCSCDSPEVQLCQQLCVTDTEGNAEQALCLGRVRKQPPGYKIVICYFQPPRCPVLQEVSTSHSETSLSLSRSESHQQSFHLLST